MAPLQPRYSKEEFARRGQEIYERDIQPHLHPADEGKFIAIDIETATYDAADADDYTATERLLTRVPMPKFGSFELDIVPPIALVKRLRQGRFMIPGIVNGHLEATIRIPILDAGGKPQDIEAVVDSGFSASLTLPPAVIARLGLAWRSRGGLLLANGAIEHFDIFAATVIWDGATRPILIEAADTDPLVGMGLLVDHELRDSGNCRRRVLATIEARLQLARERRENSSSL